MAKSKPVNFYFRLEALAWNAMLGGLGAMKLEDASKFGASVLPRLGPMFSAHKTALRNLRLAYPNETEAWRLDLRRAMWAEIGRMAGEFPHMGKFVERLERGDIQFDGREIIDSVKNKGAVYIGGHFTNWEVTSLCLAQADPTSYFTYRPANNPIIDKSIVDTRRQFGLELQAPKGREGGMGLLRALTKKRTIALMNDQKYNMGVSVPFFGHDCMTADGPTRLALKFNVPLIPISGRRTEGVKFHVRVHEPIPLDYSNPESDQSVLDGVQRVNDFMEARVREAPEQWFWVHRRWPKEAWVKAGAM
ncbi:lipid A biosynthesis lauroyl acyltransferase [alpha proteobacterium U9-1i]|nr:lipid A biosynthesis lauroyl acyltransferase [alpha proteobacterium U9-1i]